MAKNTKKAMSINGQYIEDLIDGYNTLDVSGREAHAGALKTIEKISDGNEFISRRYGGRTLTVSFVIQAETVLEVRKKLERLAGIIDVRNARIIFDDEPDKYFNAYLGENLSFSVTLGVGAGTFDLFCADPFKYDVEETLATEKNYTILDSSSNTIKMKIFEAENDGYKTFPRFEVSFPSANGSILFHKTNELNFWSGVNQSAAVIGGMEYSINGNYTKLYFGTSADTKTEINTNTEIKKIYTDDDNFYYSYTPIINGFIYADLPDGETIEVVFAKPDDASIYFGNANEQASIAPGFNYDFKNKSASTITGLNGWTTTILNTMPDNKYKSVTGSVKDSKYGVTIADHESISTKAFHGRVIKKSLDQIQNGDFTFKWQQYMYLKNKKQAGCVAIMLLDNNDIPVMCYCISNKNTSDTKGTIEFYYRNELKSWTLTSGALSDKGALGHKTVKENKKKVNKPKNTDNTITRSGKTVTVTSAINTGKPLSFEENECVSIKSIAFYFGKWNNSDTESKDLANIEANYIVGMNFESASIETSNTFSAGSNLEVDCNDMSVLLNGANKPGIGDIGNEWLDMYIDNGITHIACEWSSWCETDPTIRAYYRKRYI